MRSALQSIRTAWNAICEGIGKNGDARDIDRIIDRDSRRHIAMTRDLIQYRQREKPAITFSAGAPHIMDMRQLLLATVRALVDNPSRVSITVRRTSVSEIYDIDVSPGDRGMVIGKKGAIVAALRTLVNSIAGKGRIRTTVNIVE